jgi:hypothetical protein
MGIFKTVAVFALRCALLVQSAVPPASWAAPADGAWNSTLATAGGTINLHVDQGRVSLSRTELLNWVRQSACAVSTYYDRFPVPKVELEIVPIGERSHFITGKTFGDNGAFIRIILSQDTTVADLRKDWVLTHEMVHLAFPSVGAKHHWVEEGIATYVEPIARVEAGSLDAETVWRELVEGLPQGLPRLGDRGLDYTHTWGRTYWGGALFCLLADLRIRETTANKHGLKDALRAIVSAGGNIETVWPLARALEVGDQAVGAPVLNRLYEQMKATPITPDLPTLWKELGIIQKGAKVAFDDQAALAAVRRAIVISSTSQHPMCDSPKGS